MAFGERLESVLMSEKLYDYEIAPALADLAKKCEAAGMSFVASVEWTKGETGSTVLGVGDASGVAQVMTALAARSNGNIDAVLIGLIKRFDVSQSVFLHTHNKLQATATEPE